MDFTIQPLSLEDAMAVSRWRYPEPYTVYNYPSWETMVAGKWGIAVEEIRQAEYRSVYTEGGMLVAHYRLYLRGGKLWLGIGLRPDSCGKGYGPQIMKLILQDAVKGYPLTPVCLVVRQFNKRAIRCYEKVGFGVVDTRIEETPSGPDTFIHMAYNTLGGLLDAPQGRR